MLRSLPVSAPQSLVLPLHSRGDTRRVGRRLAACVRTGDLIVLEGDLGAGKTFLARSIARGLGVPSEIRITSPTFDLVHELPGRIPLLHLDLYRVDDVSALVELGIAESYAADAVVLCEWGERFAAVLGDDGLWLRLEVDPHGRRRCEVSSRGPRGAQLFSRFAGELAQHDFHGRSCQLARGG
jgi:tRNA threonylcarbamoyladenosine biosynthesis protein TsaE